MKKTFYLLAISLGILSQGSVLRGSEPDKDAKSSRAAIFQRAKLNLQNRLKKQVDTQSTVSHSVIHDEDSEENVKTSEQSRWHLEKQGISPSPAKERHKPNSLQQEHCDREIHKELTNAHDKSLFLLPKDILTIIDSYMGPTVTNVNSNDPGSKKCLILYAFANNNKSKQYYQQWNGGNYTLYNKNLYVVPLEKEEALIKDHLTGVQLATIQHFDQGDRIIRISSSGNYILAQYPQTGEIYLQCTRSRKKTYLDSWDYYSPVHVCCPAETQSSADLSRIILAKITGQSKTSLCYNCDNPSEPSIRPIVILGDTSVKTISRDGSYFIAKDFIKSAYNIFRWKRNDDNAMPQLLFSLPDNGSFDHFIFHDTAENNPLLIHISTTSATTTPLDQILFTKKFYTRNTVAYPLKQSYEALDPSAHKLILQEKLINKLDRLAQASDDGHNVVFSAFGNSAFGDDDPSAMTHLRIEKDMVAATAKELYHEKLAAAKEAVIEKQSKIVHSILMKNNVPLPLLPTMMNRTPSAVTLMTSLTYLQATGPLSEEFLKAASPLEKYRHLSTPTVSNIKKAHQEMYLS